MTGLAIIADDLTGALDSAAPFAARGLKTMVALSAASLPQALATGATVIAVSTDSRDIAANIAKKRVEAALGHFPPGTKLFKKVDSRLKGNLAAELDALNFEKALVVPAIPAFGRRVAGGQLVGFGVDTAIDIAERLGGHAQKAVVPDVSDQAHIAAALDASDADLMVGARALAEAVADRMASGNAPTEPALAFRRAIFVIGSRDPITLAQIERLRAERPDMVHIAAPDGAAGERIEPADALVMLQATPGPGANASDVARRLAAALETAGSLDETLLVVSGGATAQIVLDHLGIAVLELLGEALPGLPIARAGGFTLITKSGGFGAPGALVEILAKRAPIAAVGVT